MSSRALLDLKGGLSEIADLQRARASGRRSPFGGTAVVRVVNRAAVVLLCSHFERFLRDLSEEGLELLDAASVPAATIPLQFRLEHSSRSLDAIQGTQWTNRGPGLEAFLRSDGWLWGDYPRGTMQYSLLLGWFKTPTPGRIKRLFEVWGINDIFGEVTRRPDTRQHLWLKLQELADKRNNIAHGDLSEEATSTDISTYRAVVRDFCERSERRFERLLRERFGLRPNWRE